MFKSPSIQVTLNNITKYCLYTLVFLIPLFFIPWTSDILDFNKQALLMALAFVALFAWMIQVIISGSFTWQWHKTTIAMGILFLVYVLSTIFSVAQYSSFWGSAQDISESLVSVLCLVIVYFLVSQTFSEKEIKTSLLTLSVSFFLVQAYGLLQLLGWHIIPFGFAQNIGFNTIGSVTSFGFFSALTLPVFIVLSVIAKKWWKLLCLANVAFIFVAALLINYYIIWIVVLLGAGLLVFFWILNRHIFDGRWLFLPVFFLIVSLFFLVVNPKLAWLPPKPLEISLSQKANTSLDVKSLSIVGSGPGSFMYDFQKYKDKELNQDILWNVNFNVGASKFLTKVPTIGVLGALSWLLLMGCIIFYGCKYLIVKKEGQDPIALSLVLMLVVLLVTESVGFFLYHSNITLDFVYFFCAGALIALVAKNPSASLRAGKKTHVLKSSSVLTLAIIFIFTIAFIFGSVLLVAKVGQYVAEVHYQNALQSFADGKKDQALNQVKLALNKNPNVAAYFDSLALFSLSKLQDELTNPDSNISKDEQKKNINNLVSDTVNAATRATVIDAKNVDNWSAKGYVCQNLTGFFTNANDCAIQAYDKAIELSPQNPYLLIQKGSVYLANSQTLLKAEDKDQALLNARESFKKAIDLKNNYALAYFQDAITARLQNNEGDKSYDLDQAQKYAAGDAQFLLQIGIIYFQDRQWQKAQDTFQNALSQVPDYADALYYAGLTYAQQNQKDNALDMFSKLLQLDPENATIKKIIDNVKAGKPALDASGFAPQTVTPPATNSAPPKK